MNSERSAARGWVTGTLQVGVRQFLADNPPLVLLTAVLPKPVVQYLFFVLLSRVLAGPADAELAVVGGPVLALTQVAVMISDVPVADKWSGTFFRIRSGRPNPYAVMVIRTAPYPVFGLLMLMVCLLVVPSLTGHAPLTAVLITQLPLYTLMAFSTCAAGLAVALLALGKRAEVLTSNLLAYLIIMTCGVFLPSDQVPFAGPIAFVLPAHNGLIAVRAAIAGRPWLLPTLTEAAVGACWLAAGYLIMLIQIRNASRHGRDDYS